ERSKDIYEKLIRHYTPPDKSAVYAELKTFLAKYDLGRKNQAAYYQDYSYYTEDAVSHNYVQQIQKKYNLGDVSESLRNIIQRKYRWAPDRLTNYLRILYYFALSISLLVFIFRHTTTRTFFLSLLTGVLLTLFTALLMAFSGFQETGFLG